MKIISPVTFALIFVIIIYPMRFMTDIRLDHQRLAQESMMKYDQAIQTAVQDAGLSLNLQESSDQAVKYDSAKRFQVNKEAALAAFYKTLFVNFGIEGDKTEEEALKRYLPAIAVVAYDGFWINTEEKFKDERGENVIESVWKAKKPYSYADDAGNSLSFTLDDYVYAFDATTRTWHEGPRADVAAEVGGRIPLLNDAITFDEVRRTTIVNAIQDDLAYYINAHNQYARQFGISYTFTLPDIDQAEWNNTIDDVGFIAFFQGYPIGGGTYNRYALGGGRLVKAPVIYGAIRNGVKIYYRSTCNYSDTVQEKFTSEKAAAAAGYFPQGCVAP